MKKWVKDCIVNSVHKKAKYATLNVKKSRDQRDKIMSMYDTATSAAASKVRAPSRCHTRK